MATLPSGTVTFLFTDIEGSTRLAQQYPDEMSALWRDIIRSCTRQLRDITAMFSKSSVTRFPPRSILPATRYMLR